MEDMDVKAQFRITVVACVAALLTTKAVWADEGDDDSASKKVAVFRLNGPLPEAPREMEFSFSPEPRRSLYDLVDRLGKAKKDAGLRAVVLTFDQPQIGWAQVQELRSAVR